MFQRDQSITDVMSCRTEETSERFFFDDANLTQNLFLQPSISGIIVFDDFSDLFPLFADEQMESELKPTF